MNTRRKSLVPKKGYSVLEFPKSKNRVPASSLATVVYSAYHNIPLGEIRKYHIRHIKNEEIEDCRKCNLYSTGNVVMEMPAIKFNFTKGNKYFELLLKASNKTVIFDNNNDLFTLLATPHYTTPFMNRLRPQAEINDIAKQYGKHKSPYLSLIAYACYNQGVTVDNYIEVLPKIMQYNIDHNLHVEHLNGDIFDNRRYNRNHQSNRQITPTYTNCPKSVTMEKTQMEAEEMSENDGELLVERFKNSKLSQRAFCRENDIKRSTLRYWIERSEELTYGKEVNFCELVLDGDNKC